jgi:diaminopimelate decarboxylase
LNHRLLPWFLFFGGIMEKIIDNQLYISGVKATDLAIKYQTPLYVMDEELIRDQCRLFRNNFTHQIVESKVIYASKAFLNLAMSKLIQEEKLSLDCVSGGELYTAFQANFDMMEVYFHGNNKSIEELKMAFDFNVGVIVIDNEDEFHRILQIIPKNKVQKVMLRINPGIEAHTHEYIKTTSNDSKFGVSIFDPQTLTLIEKMSHASKLDFIGFHTHIGSQIFEEESFYQEAKAILDYVKQVLDKKNIYIKEINLGGGFGAKYLKDDQMFDLTNFLPRLLDVIYHYATELSIKIPKVLIEPGRAIVAEAGYTLYTISGTKTTFGNKKYIFTDGSMADHMRTALYQAKYDAVISNRVHDQKEHIYTITGKACESGDIIIKEILLPKPNENDILAVKSTGAYHYSMSSNYNRLLKPAVVFVYKGQSKIVVKRETYDDLLRNDIK